MKNFKRVALGLLVGAMAIGFSAFTNAQTTATFGKIKDLKSGTLTDAYLVQNGGDGLFNQSTTNDGTCSGTSSLYCIYDVLSPSHITGSQPYSAATITSWENAGYITPDPVATIAQYR